MALCALIAGCADSIDAPRQESSTGDTESALAVVDGREITRADVNRRIASTPRLGQSQYAGSEGEERVLQQMIEEEILYLAALEEGLPEDEAIARRLEELRRQTIVQAYLDLKQSEITRVTEEDARRFYDENADEYVTEKALRVRMLVSEHRHVVERALEMTVGGNVSFENACARFTDHGPLQTARGLLPMWVRKGRAISWFGNHPTFHDVVFALELEEISEPFELGERFAIAQVVEIREARQRDFEEVRKDVEGRLARERSSQGLPELLASLRERYGVEVFERDRPSAEELFARAQLAGSPQERVKLYSELVEEFPDHERSLESWFMLGFIRSEELGDFEGAAHAFEKVIEIDADSELAQSARWMLTSEQQEVPHFLDDPGAGSQEETP